MLEQNTDGKNNHDDVMVCKIKIEPDDLNDEAADDEESRGLIYENLEIVMKESGIFKRTMKSCARVEAAAEEGLCPLQEEVPAQSIFVEVPGHISVEIVKIEANDDEPVPANNEVQLRDSKDLALYNEGENVTDDTEETTEIKSTKDIKKMNLKLKMAPKIIKDYDKINIRQHKHEDRKTKNPIANTKCDDKLGLDLSVISPNTKPHGCDNCDKTFNSKGRLKKHIRTHTGEKPYDCELCKKSFSVKSNLNYHMRSHTGVKPFQCGVCQKTFSLKSNLETHTRTHTGEKPFECFVCRKSYNQKDNLNRHMRTHTGEKPYQCNMCQRCFANQSAMRRHVRTHTGEKPHMCKVCNKTFTARTTLINHMRTHTGEKPHQCNICMKCFSVKSSLNTHVRIHTGEKPFSCNICHKNFGDKSTLKTHFRVHSDEKPYECDVCHKCYGDQYYFRKHILRHQ